jgi:hypothetical protein
MMQFHCQNVRVGGNELSAQTSGDAHDEQVWGAGLIGRIVLCLPIVAATVWTLFNYDDWPITDTWPAFLFAVLLTLAGLRSRWSVRLTQTELLIRYPIGGLRIPRADVVSARFNWHGLIIRKRDGGKAFAFLAPRMTSTELSSGGEPGPDSAAYQITEWAQSVQPNDRSDP